MRESSQSLHDNVNTYFITIPGIARPVSRVALGTWAIGGWSVGRDRRARRHRDDPGRPLPGHQPDRYRAGVRLRHFGKDRGPRRRRPALERGHSMSRLDAGWIAS